jgi:microcystin-dependent protein
MSEPFLGEIQLFGFNYAPSGWALCNGQIMPLQQYTALFSLLGVNYGGNGTSNFGLPNLQGQAACATGQAPGLQPYVVGETFGVESVALQYNDIPAHKHVANVFNQPTTANRFGSPSADNALIIPANFGPFTTENTANGVFPPQMLGPNSGGGLPHENRQPFLALNFSIALAGDFPARP